MAHRITHCLRLGHALAFRYFPDEASPDDVEDLVEAWGRAKVRTPRRRSTVDPSAVVRSARMTFPFAHVWDRTVAGNVVPTVSMGQAVMTEVDEADAPVVAALRTPDGDMALRFHEGRLLRPVLAPMSWSPCGVDRFVDSVARGVAWADDPFAPWMGSSPLVPLDHYAHPEPAMPNVRHRAERDADAARRLADVGHLVVVDGVVHRPCPPPMCGLVVRMRRHDLEGDPLVAWVIPGQIDGQADVLTQRTGRPRAATRGMDGDHGLGTHRRCLLVPLDEVGTNVTAPDGDWRRWEGDLPFSVSRPDLWPRDAGWAMEALAALPEALGEDGLRPDPLTFARSARTAAARLRYGERDVAVPDRALVSPFVEGAGRTRTVDLLLARARLAADPGSVDLVDDDGLIGFAV